MQDRTYLLSVSNSSDVFENVASKMTSPSSPSPSSVNESTSSPTIKSFLVSARWLGKTDKASLNPHPPLAGAATKRNCANVAEIPCLFRG